MSAAPGWRVVLVGDHADMAVQAFEADGCSAAPATDTARPRDADLTVVLDPHMTHSAGHETAVWHPAAAAGGDNGVRVIARPWPVADDLFELPSSPVESSCLVIASDGAAAQPVATRLREKGLPVTVGPAAGRPLLADARIVVGLDPHLPAETFAILAAKRLLVVPAGTPAFGLQPWIDHLTFSNEDELMELMDALVAYPDSWAPIRAFGRQAAKPHRARQAIPRLVHRMQAGA